MSASEYMSVQMFNDERLADLTDIFSKELLFPDSMMNEDDFEYLLDQNKLYSIMNTAPSSPADGDDKTLEEEDGGLNAMTDDDLIYETIADFALSPASQGGSVSPPPSPGQCSSDDDDVAKRRRKRDKNNEASRVSRLKKKKEFENMKAKIEKLERENRELRIKLQLSNKRYCQLMVAK